jgi:hypothetical protein
MPQRGKKILDDDLLKALVCGASADAAAKSVGVDKRMVHQRIKDPEFRRRLNKLRADLVTRTSAMLTAASGEFVKTLIALVKEPAT